MSLEELVVGVLVVVMMMVSLVVFGVSVSSSEAISGPAVSLLRKSALSESLCCGVVGSFLLGWEKASVQTSLGSMMRGRCWKRGNVRVRGWVCVCVCVIVVCFSC
jgi:hypothetical protein